MAPILRTVGLTLALLASFTPTTQAQVSYYAGTQALNPATPSPAAQGWTEAITGNATVFGVSPDPDFQVNAWQLNDVGPGSIVYHGHTFVSSGTYEVELVMRPLAGRMSMVVDTGNLLTDDVFQLTLELVGQDIHVIEQVSGTTLVCPGAADGYHTYHFLGTFETLTLSYDGQTIGTLPYTTLGLAVPGSGVDIGTFDGQPGRFRVQNIWMANTLPLALGEYYCSPANIHSGGIRGRITATGSPFWWHNDVVLDAINLPVNQFGYFLVSATQGLIANPGGSQGNLCLTGNIGRYSSNVMNSGATGAFALPIDLETLPVNPTTAVMAGDVWRFQAWFRDQNPGPTSNFTNAVRVTFL